ncbi:MAG: valine--tRNA ligase [Candidatus Ranarchaeia archaeon]
MFKISKKNANFKGPKLNEKRWKPHIELELLDLWKKEKIYEFPKKSDKPIYSIDTPPPYISGRWHVGGAIHYSQIDMIARTKRMEGNRVIFPMSVDRNGLPVEIKIEQHHDISMHDISRQNFLDLCKDFLDKNESDIIDISKRLGLSCNSFDKDKITRTDADNYRKRTQATFIEMWNRGEIFEAERPNNWCPECNTTIADAEVEYKDGSTMLNHLIFELEGNNETLEIATTRPELLGACAAILVHPDDERYKHLVGKNVIVPIFKKKVPIMVNKEAKMEFGTGIMMVCSYGDYTDVRLFRNLQLKPTSTIGPDGKMTAEAGEYQGLTVVEARKKIIRDLENQNLIVKKEQIPQRTPTCWRSKNPIEFIAMPEYYLKQVEYVKNLKEIAETISFHPPQNKQILLDWFESITADWPISRRRFYGTEIPIWYCKSCKEPYVPPPGEYYKPWKESPPIDTCPKCSSKEGFIGEERTFDTWMDSSISCLVAIKYLEDPEFFQEAFPCSIRPQGKDIVRTWLNYTLLRVFQLTNKPAFNEVWISGMVMDDHGKTMHKSVGNVVWPEPILEKYGADALRISGALEASLGSDLRFQIEKVDASFKFLTKYWNIARFTSIFDEPNSFNLNDLLPTDKWILDELDRIIKITLNAYKTLDFNKPAKILRNFLWEIHAPHYLEMVKNRVFNREGPFSDTEKNSGVFTLHQILKKTLLLISPVIPFFTDKIFRELYNESINSQVFPEIKSIDSKEELRLQEITQLITSTNRVIWKFKQQNNLSLRDSIEEVWLPELLKEYSIDLKNMHNIMKLEFGKPNNEKDYTPESVDQQEEMTNIFIRK